MNRLQNTFDSLGGKHEMQLSLTADEADRQWDLTMFPECENSNDHDWRHTNVIQSLWRLRAQESEIIQGIMSSLDDKLPMDVYSRNTAIRLVRSKIKESLGAERFKEISRK